MSIQFGLKTGCDSKSINNHPNEIILASSERQAHNEIHSNFFPLLGRNVQQLQQSGRL
jgi:hypothetical protein